MTEHDELCEDSEGLPRYRQCVCEPIRQAREAERVETGELIVQMLSTNTIVSIWLTGDDAVRRQEAEFIFHRIRQTVQRDGWFPKN